MSKLKVLHYLNQFFGGIGGEEHAYAPVELREGPVGPGRALQQALGDAATVVGTVIGGDNYVVEEKDQALASVREIFTRVRPDVLVAGPAFDAGRYGLACAMVCRLAQELKIAAVTGMHPENVGVLTYRRDVIAVPTGTNSSEMQAALRKMGALALKLARSEPLGPATAEGYIPRGFRRAVVREKLGYERAVDMLVARVAGQVFSSEVLVKGYDDVPPAEPVKDLRTATIALITSGGVVPKGNPNRLVSGHATEFFRYSIEGLNALTVDDWESVHGGFNTTILNTKNPNYALPLPTVRELEKRGVFRALHPFYFATTGNGTAVTDATRMGVQIAKELQEAKVDAALLVAT